VACSSVSDIALIGINAARLECCRAPISRRRLHLQSAGLSAEQVGRMHASHLLPRTMEIAKRLAERLIAIDSSIVLAMLVFAVFGWCLRNLY
jgi:hypothetical protein